jgi:molecular chaperone DnaK (HSP70)
MKDANFIIGYVKDGKAVVKDHFGDGENSHAEDAKSGGKDDITNISGKESDGVTEISFTIPRNTGDTYDAVLNPGQEASVMLAYAAGMDSFLTRHKYRTHLKVNLETGSYKAIGK